MSEMDDAIVQTPASGFDMTALLAAIQDTVATEMQSVKAELASVKAELDSVRQGVPTTFETMGGQRVAQIDLGNLSTEALLAGGAGFQDAQYPISGNGLAVSDQLQRQFPMRFAPGEAVRLRPDAVHGARIVSEEILHSKTGKYLKTIRKTEPLTLGQILEFEYDQNGDAHRRPLHTCQRKIHAGGKRRITCQTKYPVGGQCPTCGDQPQILTNQYLTKQARWKYRVTVPGLTGSRGDGFTEDQLLKVASR
jgi:hypothetical protein